MRAAALATEDRIAITEKEHSSKSTQKKKSKQQVVRPTYLSSSSVIAHPSSGLTQETRGDVSDALSSVGTGDGTGVGTVDLAHQLKLAEQLAGACRRYLHTASHQVNTLESAAAAVSSDLPTSPTALLLYAEARV